MGDLATAGPPGWVAVTALVLSATLAARELVRFRRQGAWVRVSLRPGRHDKNSLQTTDARGSESRAELAKAATRFDVEVAVVEIENLGQTPVTVRNVSFDLGRTSPWRLGRHAVAFKPMDFNGSPTASRVRIEPFDSVTFVFDASHALSMIWKDRRPPLTVRASADVAGRRPARSPLRSAWTFTDGDRPWVYSIERFDLARQVFRFLAWRVRGETFAELMLPEFSKRIAAEIEAGRVPDRDQIVEMIDEKSDKERRLVLASFDLARELANSTGGLLDPAGIEERRLSQGTNATE